MGIKIKLMKPILLLTLLFFIFGCGNNPNAAADEESSNTGEEESFTSDEEKSEIKLSLTDAPSSQLISSVVVSFNKIELNISGFRDDDRSWTLLSDSSEKIELLNLTNGRLHNLALKSVPPGHYNQIKIHVESAEAIVDGNFVDLVVPSNVLKLSKAIEIGKNISSHFIIDFDVSRSIVKAGDKHILKPFLRIVDEKETGSIIGSVDSKEKNQIIIQSFKSNTNDPYSGTVSEPSGEFTLAYHEPGTYDIEVSSKGFKSKRIPKVAVLKGSETDLVEQIGTIVLSRD